MHWWAVLKGAAQFLGIVGILCWIAFLIAAAMGVGRQPQETEDWRADNRGPAAGTCGPRIRPADRSRRTHGRPK